MHEICVVVADKNVPSSPHIGGELLDIIERPLGDRAADFLIAQITDHKDVRGGRAHPSEEGIREPEAASGL